MERKLLIASLAACVVSLPVAAYGDTKNAPNATRAGDGTAGVISSTPNRTESMQRLTDAAQRLREAIQAMAQAPAGEKRNTSIEAAREALRETQQAMIDLPPELRVRSGSMNEAEYGRAMDKLKQAAQRLRESSQAMAQQPVGERRNQAMEQVDGALLEIHQAMVQLPWQPTPTTRTSVSMFDRIDKNRDGVLSREEYQSQYGMQTSARRDAGTGR